MAVESKLIELYLSNIDLIGDGFPAAFNRERGERAEALRLGALPGAKDERYHLVDIAGLYGESWEYYFTSPGVNTSRAHTCGQGMSVAGACGVDVVGGFTDESLIEREDGLIYGSLKTAYGRHEALVSKYFDVAPQNAGKDDALVGLNALFVRDGAFVRVPDGLELDVPIVVDMRYASSEEAVASFARTLLCFGRDSKAKVAVLHRSSGQVGCLANSVCEIVVEQGADVDITFFSCMNPSDVLLDSTLITQQAGSTVHATAIALGGRITRRAFGTTLAGEDAEAGLRGLYIASNEERTAFDVRVRHLVPGCPSHELVKGIAAGSAQGSFTGHVYVAPGAQRTNAMQQSRNIELGGGAKIYARPRLEIYADDVKCSHGATVGQLDQDAVYYMQQRGIDPATARAMQLEGFVKDITSQAGYGRETIDILLQEKISAI